MEDENLTAEEFLKSYTMTEIVDMLYDILKDVESAEENGIDCTELDLYESVLSQNESLREKRRHNVNFNREWKQSDIRNIVENNSYLEFGQHEDLKALCICPFAEDDTSYKPDYQEATYVVPCNWLKETEQKSTRSLA